MIKKWKQFENYYDFNCGDCYIYAIAMHRLYGYPIYGVKLFFKEDDFDYIEDPQYDYEYAHIIVKEPNGKFIDQDGKYNDDELKRLSKTSYTEFIKIEEISEFEARTAYLGMYEKEEEASKLYREEDILKVMDMIKNGEI